MAPPGTLSSDHVNYLIFRYLQESGHEKTALAFTEDWYRPREYNQPENFPFAHTVNRSELVSVIQNGLTYDELQARVGRNERRFRWIMGGSVGARESVEDDGMGGDTERENGTRPPSSGKRKGRVPPVGGMRAPDEFPTPAPKRQRVSDESESVHINGDRDAMDVDATSASPADAEEDAEEASPAAESDDAAELPAERYDSMDVATQTEVRTGPKTSTIAFTVSKPGSRIFHSSWSPSKDNGDNEALLAVGEDLCRYYRIPELLDGDLKTISHIDEPTLPPNSIITATAWHPNGRLATCAVDSIRELSGDKQTPTQMLMDIGRDIGTVIYPLGMALLEPPGMIMNIRYSPKGEYVLVVKTNLRRGLVQIWKTLANPDKPHIRAEPLAWRIFEHPVLEAAWSSEQTFVVCGEQGLVCECTLASPQPPATNGFTAATVALHNLSEIRLDNKPDFHVLLNQEPVKWDKLCYDEYTSFFIVASSEQKKVLLFGTTISPNAKMLELPQCPIALAVQPRKSIDVTTAGSNPRKNCLATIIQDGRCILHTLGADENGECKATELCTFDLGERALALSWSPDEKHLAVAGTDIVRIWRIDPPESKEEVIVDTRPLVTWRPQSEANGAKNGEYEQHSDGDAQSEPCLSWSADGERLSFAVDKQISIVSFRPPLSSEGGEQVNGGASP